jgi:hypothetical protein
MLRDKDHENRTHRGLYFEEKITDRFYDVHCYYALSMSDNVDASLETI